MYALSATCVHVWICVLYTPLHNIRTNIGCGHYVLGIMLTTVYTVEDRKEIFYRSMFHLALEYRISVYRYGVSNLVNSMSHYPISAVYDYQ